MFRLWPPNDAKLVVAALRRDDRPLRDEYARRADWTLAAMRDRLAEPGDHLRPAWASFEDYRASVLAAAKAFGRRGICRLWKQELADSSRSRAFRLPAISDFTLVVHEGPQGTRTVEFWPDDPPGRPSRTGPPYVVPLA